MLLRLVVSPEPVASQLFNKVQWFDGMSMKNGVSRYGTSIPPLRFGAIKRVLAVCQIGIRRYCNVFSLDTLRS